VNTRGSITLGEPVGKLDRTTVRGGVSCRVMKPTKTIKAEKPRCPMNHHPHILNASCNLLGICFIIIGSLKLADLNSRSYGDEIAWAATSLFFVSIITSYFLFGIITKTNGS
jgi:hypothetical protein